jgi:hypothetical protein
MADEQQPPQKIRKAKSQLKAVVAGGTPKTPEEIARMRGIAHRLAGIIENPGTATVATPPDLKVVPIKPVPPKGESIEWWREHVGALLLLIDSVPGSNPVEVMLEAVSPNGNFLRVRPTPNGGFIWRPTDALTVLDVIADPGDLGEYWAALQSLYPAPPAPPKKDGE